MGGAKAGDEAVAASSVPTVQQMGFALGAALDQTMLDHSHGRKFLGAFNAAAIALNWRHVEPTEGFLRMGDGR